MELFTAQQIQSLNELELLVYRYINEHPNTVPFMRIRELATEAHVSTTTVLHFCKKMGCDGYAQFKWKLKEQAGTNQETHLPDTLNELQNFLWRVGTPEYDAALDEAAGLIARAERVFLVGIGNSGSMAEYGARYLSNLGKFALSVTDPFYPVTVTPNVTMTAVLLSVSGETVQILHLAQQFKARGCSLIAITSSPQSTLAKMADMTLPYYTTARRVGGAIGALIISFFNTKYYVYAGLPGLLTTVNAMSDANPSSFTGMMIGVAATIIVTIILVQIVGCDEKEPKNN